MPPQQQQQARPASAGAAANGGAAPAAAAAQAQAPAPPAWQLGRDPRQATNISHVANVAVKEDGEGPGLRELWRQDEEAYLRTMQGVIDRAVAQGADRNVLANSVTQWKRGTGKAAINTVGACLPALGQSD